MPHACSSTARQVGTPSRRAGPRGGGGSAHDRGGHDSAAATRRRTQVWRAPGKGGGGRERGRARKLRKSWAQLLTCKSYSARAEAWASAAAGVSRSHTLASLPSSKARTVKGSRLRSQPASMYGRLKPSGGPEVTRSSGRVRVLVRPAAGQIPRHNLCRRSSDES